MSHDELSDEDKLDEAIRFIATGQPLPTALEDFLVAEGLYDVVVHRREAACQH